MAVSNPGLLPLHGFQPSEATCPVAVAGGPWERPWLVQLETHAHLAQCLIGQVWVHLTHQPSSQELWGAVRPSQLLQTRLAPGRRNSYGTVREGAVRKDRRHRWRLCRLSEKGNLRAALSYGKTGDLLCVSNWHIRILGLGLWFRLWRSTDWLKPRVHYMTLQRIQVNFRSTNDFKIFIILPSWKTYVFMYCSMLNWLHCYLHQYSWGS